MSNTSRSIGQVRGTDATRMVEELAVQLAEHDPNRRSFDQLHVWPKDRVPIGRFGFEPGVDEVSKVVADEVYAGLRKTWVKCDAPNRIAQPGERVLDLVLVEPSHWFLGTPKRRSTRWPGTSSRCNSREPVSRAYYNG